jgi:hypothetical protein
MLYPDGTVTVCSYFPVEVRVQLADGIDTTPEVITEAVRGAELTPSWLCPFKRLILVFRAGNQTDP